MAGSLTKYGESLVLDKLFNANGQLPDDLYLGLATATMDDEDDLSSVQEEDDGAYVRQPVTFTSPSDNGTNMEVENDSLIEFPSYAADADSGVTHAFITDAESGTSGGIISWMVLAESKTPSSGEKLTVPAGNFKITID